MLRPENRVVLTYMPEGEATTGTSHEETTVHLSIDVVIYAPVSRQCRSHSRATIACPAAFQCGSAWK